MKTLTPSQSEENKTSTRTKLVVAVISITLLGLSGFAIWKILAPKSKKEVSTPRIAEVVTKTPEPEKIPLTAAATTGAFQPPPQTPEGITPPILAIPRDQAGTGGVPRGFGFEQPQPVTNEQQGLPDPDQAISLQKPTAPAPPVEPAKADPNAVDTIDPRVVGITANDGPQKEYEETSLTIQRTLTAVVGEDKQLIRIKVPVMYKSRTMRLQGESLAEAQRLQKALGDKATQLATLKKEMETLLVDWNKLVEKTTPQDVLLPESPTLPANQSAGKLNREENATMEPGKAISFEIVSPTP